MISIDALLKKLETGVLDQDLENLYPGNRSLLNFKKERIKEDIVRFSRLFEKEPWEMITVISSPLSLEIEGYFQDCYQGKIWNITTDSDCMGCASKNSTDKINVYCPHYGWIHLSLNERRRSENTVESILSGLVEGFENLGFSIRGFDAFISIGDLRRDDLSTIAALEILIGLLINELFCLGSVSIESIVQMDQFIHLDHVPPFEYYSRQINGALGGILITEFNCFETYTSLQIRDLFKKYTLFRLECGIDSSGTERMKNLISEEVKEACQLFSKDYLGDIQFSAFLKELPKLSAGQSEPVIQRISMAYQAIRLLEEARMKLIQRNQDEFFSLFSLSGQMSNRFILELGRKHPVDNTKLLSILKLCEKLLGKNGSYRIMISMDSTTVQALVPDKKAFHFERIMVDHLGQEAVHKYNVRSIGAYIFT